jgi:hypothetical protein
LSGRCHHAYAVRHLTPTGVGNGCGGRQPRGGRRRVAAQAAKRIEPLAPELEQIIIRAFDVLPNGLLAKQSDRVFADLRGSEPGVSDGMKVDVEGNVYCGGAGGLWILDPKGKKLGRIVHGQPATTNMGFGGDDWKTLYFTTRTHLGAVNVKIPGMGVPTQKH